jgi:hypothetical protein
MSTAHIDPRANEYTNLDSNSANAMENGMSSVTPSTPILSNDNNESYWTYSFARFDQICSGSLLELIYRFLDIIILFIGLSSRKDTCTLSSRLAITSICLLVFYFIDLTIIVYGFFRNISSSYQRLNEEERVEHFRRVKGIRNFFSLFKLIPVIFGTRYALSSLIPNTTDCQLMRFCLGIVCLSTLLTMIIPPTRPEIPPRRSFLLECFILSFLLIINGTYLGTVASAMKGIEQSTCIYNQPDDLYLRAPLKTYAYVGLLLFGCTTAIHIINLLISQTCNRLTNGRRLYSYYYGLQYALNYFSAVIVIYYFSVGALLLFKPRSGEPCKTVAPGLYRTLLIWQWIRILFPLLAVPLVLILCCLGVFLGIILSYCLPASITVPLLGLLQVR